MAEITSKKAKTILREGMIGGKPITEKQKGFFGARAGGQPVKTKQLSALKRAT